VDKPGVRAAASGTIVFVFSPNLSTPASKFAGAGLTAIALDQLPSARLAGAAAIVFDVDVDDADVRATIRAATAKLRPMPPLIFAVDRGASMHFQTTQANAMGARTVIRRPVTAEAIAQSLAVLSVKHPTFRSPIDRRAGGASIAAAHQMIGASFAALSAGAPLQLEQATAASHDLFSGVGQAGLHNWLDLVREHHAGTFQHCMLVTGAVVAYVAEAGMPEAAATSLTIAALLHDIGKAEIPNAILDKPGKLTEAEFDIIRGHPRIGADYLKTQTQLPSAIIDPVLHHHEYLDGSGYPDGLVAARISLATRILTVCDIYGAMVEKRAYKPPLSQHEALYTLIGMAQRGKVDYAVVRTLASALGTALPEDVGAASRTPVAPPPDPASNR
jgi:putative nucleotidyltransferase with HDIG domain